MATLCETKPTPDLTQNIMWWTFVTTAVLAIPAMASIVVVTLQPSGFSSIALFVISCWLCVYAGIKLVKNPKITFPYMLEHIHFSEDECTRNVSIISAISEDIINWKNTYDRCSSAFMNISKQPAWGHIDSLMQTLNNIKDSIDKQQTIHGADIRNLSSWFASSKSSTIDAYLHALRGVYIYGKATAEEQNHSLDEMYPELDKGILQQFEYAPNRMKAYGLELLSDVRRKYPFVAAQLNYTIQETQTNRITLVAKRS